MRRGRLIRQQRDRAVLLPRQYVEPDREGEVQGMQSVSVASVFPEAADRLDDLAASEDWAEEPQNYNWQFDPEEWGEHAHYCDICCSNWKHDESPECRYGGAARCPEHEGEDA